MIDYLKITLIFYALLVPIIYGKTTTKKMRFFVKGGPIILDVPSGWEAKQGVWGFPLSIIRPSKVNIGKYEVINFVPTPVYIDSISEYVTNRHNNKIARETRRYDIEKRGGKFYNYSGIKKVNLDTVGEAYKNTFRYYIDNANLLEEGFFFMCGKQLYSVLAILNDPVQDSVRQEVDIMLNSMSCKFK